MITGRKKLRPD